MTMEQTQNRFEETEALDSLDIRDEIAKYLRYWPWLILSVVIALSAAFLYVRYTPNIYKSSTRIIIKDSKNPSEEEAILSNMGFQSGTASTNLENELAIFKSRRIMYSVVEALDLHVQYFAEGQFNNIEIYDHLSLVKLEYISGDEFTNLLRISFENNQVSILDTETEKVYKTNFQEIFKFFLEAIKEINKILSLELPSDLSALILANIKKNLANYSYLCAVVSKIHSDYPNLIVYHSGSSFFSAVTRRIGVRTRYLLHGLMGQVGKLSYPIYDQIHVYCKEEAEYLRKMSPKSEVKLYSFKDMKDFKKKIVIFMRIEDYLMKKEDLGEVISVFKKNSYEIILKRHPTYNGSLVKDLLTSHNVRLSENNTLDATEIILEEKPSFTVGWLSTSLCESLQSGVIPITLKDNKNPMDSNMESPLIYPIEKRSFSWKNERETINRLLIRMEEYPNFLETLKTR